MDGKLKCPGRDEWMERLKCPGRDSWMEKVEISRER